MPRPSHGWPSRSPCTRDAVRVAPIGAAPLRLVVADSADDSWAKIRFGAAGWQPVAELLPRIAAAPTRVVLYNTIRDAVRDAGLDPAQALDMVLAAPPWSRWSWWRLSCWSSPPASWPATTPSPRTGRAAGPGLPPSRTGCWPVPSPAATQLEAARAAIRASDDGAWLAAWRAGEQVPAGLAIDAEIRWALVTRLAALGALSEADIDAELARDESAAGVVHAARARALRPDPAAKQATWALLTEPSRRPAYELYASARASSSPARHELTAGYLSRFFAEMPATASHRHGWALGWVVFRAFPVSAASPDLLRLAEEALAGPRAAELPPPVRRALVDGTDALRRVVRSLQRYGGA